MRKASRERLESWERIRDKLDEESTLKNVNKIKTALTVTSGIPA